MALPPPFRTRDARPPLDADGLDRLAIAYVGRYATTRAKLIAYLKRKLGERGGAPGVDPVAVADRVVALGYVDDAGFAAARAGALARRGYGARRVDVALRAVDRDRDRALAAFARAGHASAVARLLVDRDPGDMPDAERN